MPVAADGERKANIDDLAIFGGRPLSPSKLHVGCPNIGDRERLFARLNDILDRRYLTNDGPYAREFEERVCQLIGVKHCVATCNGTAALQLALRAAGCTGDVVVPSFTFVATAHAVSWQRLRPVFADVHPGNHTLDHDDAAAAITPCTSAIVGVHLWGYPCDVDALGQLARRHQVHLIFDAAHAFACTREGRMIGNFGDAETFSFHATKFVTCLEGGAVVTNDDDLAASARLLRNHGFSDEDQVNVVGTNAKMSEFSAAMGLTQLEDMAQTVRVNRSHYLCYRQELDAVPGIRLLEHDMGERRNFQYMVAEVDAQAAGISRDDLLQVLRAENVLARRYFYPGCHRMRPYRRTSQGASARPLPVTDAVVERVMVLPTGTALDTEHVERICEVIRLVATKPGEVARRLSA